MNWLVLFAATVAPNPAITDPATCQRIGAIVQQVIQAQTGAPAAIGIRCQPSPVPSPRPPAIPESALPVLPDGY